MHSHMHVTTTSSLIHSIAPMMHVTSYHSRCIYYIWRARACMVCICVPCEVADATMENNTSAAIPIVKQVFICEQILKHKLFYFACISWRTVLKSCTCLLHYQLTLCFLVCPFSLPAVQHTDTQLTNRHCRQPQFPLHHNNIHQPHLSPAL